MPRDAFAAVDTIPEVLARRAELTPDAVAYREQRPDGAWDATTWRALHDAARRLAAALAREGLGHGCKVGILAPTSVAWETVQLAALMAGGVVTGLDPYYPDALLSRLVADAGLDALFVDDAATLDRLPPERVHAVRVVVVLRGAASAPAPNVRALAALIGNATGAPSAPPAPRPDAPAIVTYSSGSTGTPRPVVYAHAQVVHACRAILATFPEVAPGARLVCWLPLANLFQRMVNLCGMLNGATSYVIADPRRLMDVLPVARPHVLIAVPRFCEKVQAGMMERVHANRVVGRWVDWRLGDDGAAAPPGPAWLARRGLYRHAAARAINALVLARMRKALGGDLRFIVSGSAPMPAPLLAWYERLGIPVLEAYGISEDIVPVAANRLQDRRAGTVGKPVGDNVVRIAADGEVQVRGRGVFVAALQPANEREAALSADGYLRTGDLGRLDDDGYLVLEGRRNEAFKNAQGRWISLPVIEAALRRVPGVEHAAAAVAADGRVVAVLAPPAGAAAAAGAPALEAALRDHLSRAVAALPAAMRPSAYVVATRGFTPATGEITTNLKLRRAAIAERFAEPIARALEPNGPPSGPADPRMVFV